jgi:hypothetical protein
LRIVIAVGDEDHHVIKPLEAMQTAQTIGELREAVEVLGKLRGLAEVLAKKELAVDNVASCVDIGRDSRLESQVFLSQDTFTPLPSRVLVGGNLIGALGWGRRG